MSCVHYLWRFPVCYERELLEIDLEEVSQVTLSVAALIEKNIKTTMYHVYGIGFYRFFLCIWEVIPKDLEFPEEAIQPQAKY